MEKVTAVNWLKDVLEDRGSSSHLNLDWSSFDDLVADAKLMEKEQMIEFAKGFWYYANGSDAPPCYNEDVEKYYNKVYSK